MGRIEPWVLSLLGSRDQPSSPGSGQPETLMPGQGKGLGLWEGKEAPARGARPWPWEADGAEVLLASGNEKAGPAKCTPGQ